MPNLAGVLKEEISRLARKEIRVQLKDLKETNKVQKKEISSLKKQISSLERDLKRIERAAPASVKKSIEKPAKSKVGLTAKGLKSHRKRMGISAGDYAKLAGVSAATIYNFESGKSNPRQSVLAKLDAVRDLGKRDIKAKLKTDKPAKVKTAKPAVAKSKPKATARKTSAKKTTRKKASTRKKTAPQTESPATEETK